MWTDSTTALEFPTLAANRVSEKLNSTTIDQWFYVPSADNPADARTRGMSANYLCASSWLKAQIFLCTPDFSFQPNIKSFCDLKNPLKTLSKKSAFRATFPT